MESSESFPDIISENSYCLASIFLKGPASLGQVTVNIVQKGFVENCVFIFKLSSLIFLLYVSKMTIIFQLKGFLHIHADESFVSLDFMLLIHFHSAMRYNVAIVINCSDVIVESIDFFHINLFNIQWRIVRASRSQQIILRLVPCCNSGLNFSPSFWVFAFDMN